MTARCQAAPTSITRSTCRAEAVAGEDWGRGAVLPAEVMALGNAVVSDRAKRVVQPPTPIHRKRVTGTQLNADIWMHGVS